MPWSRNENLPASVRGVLPEEAQTRFREVANERMRGGASEQSAIAQAWHVVGIGWKKPRDGGEWVRKNDQPSFIKAEVVKVSDELGLVFGWAITCKVDGESYFDSQGDHIPEDSMLKALADFMEHSRVAKEMHGGEQVGEVVFAFPLTAEVAKAMGIETKFTGAMVAMKPGPEVLAKFRDGIYTGFSIGGFRLLDEDVAA